MKKTLACFFLLLAAVAGGTAAVFSQVYAARDQVRIKQETLYGDPAAAQGLTAHIPAQYQHHLFWNTDCTFGEETQAVTSYEFSAIQKEEPPQEREPFLEMNNQIWYGYDSEAKEGLPLAYQELFDDTPAGSENSRVIHLKDYYETYPLQLGLEFPVYSSVMSQDVFLSESIDPDEAQLYRAFEEFFQIPVLVEETMEISVGKSTDGGWVSSGSGSTESDRFDLYTVSAVADDACYFAFDAHTQLENLVDVSQIAGGFGIYCLPFDSTPEGEDSSFPLLTEELATVYPLDPQDRILDLTLSPDQSRLLLHTQTDGMYVITVIDRSTMEAVQRVEVGEVSEERMAFRQLYEGNGFFAVQVEWNTLAAVRWDENGICQELLFVPISPDPENPLVSFQFRTLAMDFDGEKLAVCDYQMNEQADNIVDVVLAVYDKTGMVYCGSYANSLSLGGVKGDYTFSCRPLDNGGMTVTWES